MCHKNRDPILNPKATVTRFQQKSVPESGQKSTKVRRRQDHEPGKVQSQLLGRQHQVCQTTRTVVLLPVIIVIVEECWGQVLTSKRFAAPHDTSLRRGLCEPAVTSPTSRPCKMSLTGVFSWICVFHAVCINILCIYIYYIYTYTYTWRLSIRARVWMHRCVCVCWRTYIHHG